MTKYEFHKYGTRFNVLLITVLMVCNLIVAVIQYRSFFSSEYELIEHARENMLELALNDPFEYDRIYENFASRYKSYCLEQEIAVLQPERKAAPLFVNELICLDTYGDANLIHDTERILDRSTEFREEIYSVLQDCAARIYESDNRNTYSYRYYVKLAERYINIANMDLGTSRVYGWNEFFSLQTPIIFLTAALITTMCGTFTIDKYAGMNIILRVSKKGRRAVVCAKLRFICSITAIFTLIFSLSPLFVIAISCGLSSISEPVQVLDAFRLCPYSITIGQYLCIFLMLRILFFTVFTLSIAVVSQILQNDKAGILLSAVLIGTSVILYNISPSSKYYILQKFSLIELFDVHIFFTHYQVLNIFGFCADFLIIVIVCTLIIMLALIIISFTFREQSVIRTVSECKMEKYSCRGNLSLFSMELYKIWISEGQIYLLICVIILKIFLSLIAYIPDDSNNTVLYREYISDVSGRVTQEKLDYIAEEEQYIRTALEQYGVIEQAYKRNEVSEEDFLAAQKKYNYAKYCEIACKKLCERRDYLLSKLEDVPNIAFVYEEGIERYLTSTVDFAAVIFMILFYSGVFSSEYEHGFAKIMRTDRCGRTPVYYVKTLMTLLTAVVMFAILSLIDIVCLLRSYSLDYLNSPIVSIPLFGDCGIDTSILCYAVIYKLISLAGYFCGSLLISALSILLENKIKTVGVSSLIIFLPYFISKTASKTVSAVSLLNFLSPSDIKNGIVTYVTVSIFTLITVVASALKWNGGRTR